MDQGPIETTLYSLSESVPERRERREDERYLTLFRVGSLTIGDRQELCLVKNVSAGGMLIRPYSDLQPGSRLVVELKQGQPVEGTVSWVEDGSAGIEFDQRIDIVELLTTSADGPRPRMPRMETRCHVSVRFESNVYRVRSLDVSQGGLKVECGHDLPLGSDIVVTLPGLPPEAGVVRWQHNGCYGISFNRLIALGDLVAWLQDVRETAAQTAVA